MSVSWSIQPIANFFPCINSNGEGSKKLNKKSYILSEQKEKAGRPISDEMKQAVEHFYESRFDQYSRIYSGKDFVLVKIDSIRQHKQKRLLLCNLKELHIEFLKSAHLQICQLRPKWCITVNSESGIQFVGIYEIHENVELFNHSFAM